MERLTGTLSESFSSTTAMQQTRRRRGRGLWRAISDKFTLFSSCQVGSVGQSSGHHHRVGNATRSAHRYWQTNRSEKGEQEGRAGRESMNEDGGMRIEVKRRKERARSSVNLDGTYT